MQGQARRLVYEASARVLLQKDGESNCDYNKGLFEGRSAFFAEFLIFSTIETAIPSSRSPEASAVGRLDHHRASNGLSSVSHHRSM